MSNKSKKVLQKETEFDEAINKSPFTNVKRKREEPNNEQAPHPEADQYVNLA